MPMSRGFLTLALVEEDPTDEWAFSYDYPNTCLFVRRIISGVRQDAADTRVPYIIAQDTDGRKLIYTNTEDAQIEATVKCDNPALYPDDLSLAISLRLATYIAPIITNGDPYKLGPRAFRLYGLHIGRGVATANNEEQLDVQPDSSSIRSRE
jgi:hypothetical protein